MASLYHPHPLSARKLCAAPKSRLLCSRSMRIRSCATRSTNNAIVFFKHDLRVEDHPGLVAAASQHECVVPLYVFDRRILSRFSDETLEVLLFALEDLRKMLKAQGSNLMIRFGSAENVIEELVKEVGARSIFLEEEVEYELCLMLDTIKDSFSSLKKGSPRIVTWNTPFYSIKSLMDLPSSYDKFKKLKLPVVSAIAAPKIHSGIMNLNWGDLPSLDDLKIFMEDNADGAYKEEGWASMKKLSAGNMLQRKITRGNFGLKQTETNEYNQQGKRKINDSAFETSQGTIVGGGANTVLNALAAYLRYLEGTARDEWQEVHDKLRLAEKREGASFGALFSSALLLGIISRRRVYDEAIKYEKERNGGNLTPFGYSTATVAAAIDTVSSIEWYHLLTLKGQQSQMGKFPIRIWRWKNHLVQYTVAGYDGPAVLLVHGFGAFLEHYRGNLNPIAEGGNRVWAITLLGFGRSEKPNIIYTELVWAELIRDFIIEVVGEPVHLVGNSIGGYAVAIVAGLWSSLAKSVVLMNSAGSIIPAYSARVYPEDKRISGAAWLVAKLLLLYLRFQLKNILRNFYPTKTDRADDWLVDEMIRSSYDPGVTYVLESIFSFDLSLPLNYLLDGFKNRILIVQGMKDPLYDSKSMLAMVKEHCQGVVVKEIDAGHCPHDEMPSEVNSSIIEWVAAFETASSQVASKQRS